MWGYPKRTTLRFIFNQGFPTDLLRWHLTTGAFWKSPLFTHWLEDNRAVLWSDAVKEFNLDPEAKKQMEQAGVQHSLMGGVASDKYFVLFAADMETAKCGRLYLSQFEAVLPDMVEASQRAYPRNLLTLKETTILARRVQGEVQKQIAAHEGISERTVRGHLDRIKRKLYTTDLVNAVVIAVRSGLV